MDSVHPSGQLSATLEPYSTHFIEGTNNRIAWMDPNGIFRSIANKQWRVLGCIDDRPVKYDCGGCPPHVYHQAVAIT